MRRLSNELVVLYSVFCEGNLWMFVANTGTHGGKRMSFGEMGNERNLQNIDEFAM